MTQLSKERLEEIALNDFATHAEAVEMARRLLAVEGREPVAWAHRLINKRNGITHPWVYGSSETSPSEGDVFHVEVMSLYAAPPAPVAQPVQVPKEVPEWLKDRLITIYDVVEDNDEYCQDIWNACRAAMLKAEPVSQPYKLPDGYVLVPVKPTLAMLTVLGFTGSFESMKQRYEAMLDAAPQPQNAQQNIPGNIPAGWTGNGDADAALVMLDRIDTVDADDDERIECVKRTIRVLAAPQEPTK